MEFLLIALIYSGYSYATAKPIVYDTVASQTEAADKRCGKDQYNLFNKPVALDSEGNDVYFICK